MEISRAWLSRTFSGETTALCDSGKKNRAFAAKRQTYGTCVQASLLRRASTKRQRSFPKRSRHTLTNLVPAGTALGYLFSYCFSIVVAVPTVSGNLIHGNSSATFLP